MSALHDWLLDSDPAIRWQVERDITHEPEAVWQATRARVATEGFGARLLALQDPDGQWAGGAHFPADFTGDGPQPWTATTWSLNALREWGVDASAMGETAERIAASAVWEYDGSPFWGGEVDVCINSYTLSNGAWLGLDESELAQWFVEHRMSDGGWNCEWEEGSTKSSFHSTLNAVIGLRDYEERTGGSDELRAARHAGEEYLLERHLIRRLSTGEAVAPWVTHFSYPYRHRYNVLRATDHFRRVAALEGTAPDLRIQDAVELVRAARQPDGRWPQGETFKGRQWFPVDVPEGQPSKWLTLDGTRVLDWWDGLSR